MTKNGVNTYFPTIARSFQLGVCRVRSTGPLTKRLDRTEMNIKTGLDRSRPVHSVLDFYFGPIFIELFYNYVMSLN